MDDAARTGLSEWEDPRAGEALRRSEARYRALAAVASDAVWCWSPGGGAGDFSDTQRWWADLTGQPPEEQNEPAAGWLAVVHPDDRADAEAAWTTSLATGRKYDVEYRVRARSGGWRWVRARGVPVRGRDGAVVEWVGTLDDVTERRAAEEARREGEGRFRALMEQAPLSVQVFTPDGRTLGVNRAWEELWGLTLGQLADYNLLTDPQLEARGVAPYLRRAAAGETVAIPAIRYDPEETLPGRTSHGDPRRWVSAVAYPLRDLAGRVREVVLVHQDVTVRHLAEEAVRRNEAWLRTVTDSLPALVGYVGRDLRYRFANRSYEEWFGVRPADVLGRSMSDLLGEEEFRLRRRHVDAALAGEAVRFETRTRHRSLGSRATEVTYTPHREGGGVAGFFVHVHDVTDRRRAADELARVTAEADRRKRLYETILSSTPDFVYVFSLDHRVLYANKALIEMWGRGPGGAIGKTFLEIGYEPWHAEMHAREIDTVRATRRPIRGEVPFTGTNGRRIYDYIFVPVLGAGGEVEAVAGTTRDVTDRKAMEDDLREAGRKKDEFIALLAHELRNPLAPIRNGLQVLRLAEDRDVRRRAQEMMDRQLTHMVRLIDDLLDASRIGRGKMPLRRTRLTLAEAVHAAVETAGPAVEEAGHELTVSLPEGPVHLDANLTRLAQVFANLLTNAAKYTPRGGKIWLAAEPRGGGVGVTVRDTGVGIPADALPTVFDMFSQVDRGVERATGGLGIGLALVKGLVEMHGGTVAAASAGEGRGSTFTVTLPVLAAPAGPGAAPPAARVRPRGRRVLVVDDNRDGAGSMAEMLRLLGHVAATAHDGLDAVERAGAWRPDVVLMDVGMPRLDGLEAARRIRAEPWGRRVLIVALTGWGQEGDRERSRQAGCDGHLVKPVALADLERVLAEGLPGG